MFDVGDTMLAERWFDLEAGIAAVVGDRSTIPALASEFRSELSACHQQHREPLLAKWLRERMPVLASVPVAVTEDAIWATVVSLQPRPGIAAVLRQLATDGVLTAAVSNAAFSGRVLLQELGRHGLAGHVRFVLSSADLSIRKPDVRIFEAAVARLGVKASHVWFIGDTLEEDMAGAVATGLRPIWFSSGAAVPPEYVDQLHVVRDWAEFEALYATAKPSARSGGPVAEHG